MRCKMIRRLSGVYEILGDRKVKGKKSDVKMNNE